MSRLVFVLLIQMILASNLMGQEKQTNINVDGKMYPAIITPEGDTLILAELDEVSISTPDFASQEDYDKYLKMKRYAEKVYPYAKEAVKIWREAEYAEKTLSKKEQKRRFKELEKELTEQFEKPLSGLTKLQGKIMIKMIEREINQPMYNLIKKVKGGFTAFYWHNFSKLYSYDLKEGYVAGAYPVLDVVLKDYDLSHQIIDGKSMKYFNIEEIRNRKKNKK
jgi:hypothetical protein